MRNLDIKLLNYKTETTDNSALIPTSIFKKARTRDAFIAKVRGGIFGEKRKKIVKKI